MTMNTTHVKAAETSPAISRLLNLEELLRQKSHFL